MSFTTNKNLTISINNLYENIVFDRNIVLTNPNHKILHIVRNLKIENFIISVTINKTFKNQPIIEKKIREILILEFINIDNVIFEEALDKNLIIYEGISLSLQELILKYKFKNLFPSISIVSSFYNEEKNIDRFWMQANELSKYLNVNEFVFINNGSKDNTLKKIKSIAKKDPRVKYSSNDNPTCYSKGFSSGISLVTSDYTLITHSDCQINVDTTIKRWLESSSQKKLAFDCNAKLCIFSYRLNRPPISQFLSFVNNLFAKNVLGWSSLLDFNAQPKIIHSSLIKNFYFEKGYLFDLALINWLNQLEKKRHDIKFLNPIAVIDSPRLEGNSSWSSSPLKFFKISLSYLFFALSLRIKK